MMNNKTRNLLLTFLVLFLVSSCVSVKNIRTLDATTNTPRPLTVMAYNIRVGAGRADYGRNPYQLKDVPYLDTKPIIEAIRSKDPDIVGLQEVLGFDQLAEIGEALNMNYAYEPHSVDSYGSWWGVGILSKFPIDEVHATEISAGRGNTKSILIADVNLFGKKVVLISAHKDAHLRDGKSFYKMRQRINSTSEPVILIADLNIWPGDGRHTILAERLVDTAILAETQNAAFARKRGTFPGKHNQSWGKRLDYILVDKQYFDVLDAGLIDEKHWSASDHLGYYTRIKLK